MALINCPECGKQISDRAASCIYCGYPLHKQQGEREITNIRNKESAIYEIKTPSYQRSYEPRRMKKKTSSVPKWLVILLLFIFYPVGVVLLWKHDDFKKIGKIFSTVILGIPFLLFLLFVVILTIPVDDSGIGNVENDEESGVFSATDNSKDSIGSYLEYLDTIVPEGEKLAIESDLYDNMESVEIMGKHGTIDYSWNDVGRVYLFTWTSNEDFTEKEYISFAKKLNKYFGHNATVKEQSFATGDTTHYYWVDTRNGCRVSLGHGSYWEEWDSFDYMNPDGDIMLVWNTDKDIPTKIDTENHTHGFSDATCDAPRTCYICGKIEGEALGHTPSEWSEWDINYDTAKTVREIVCTTCEEVIETQSENVTSFVKDGYFLLYPDAFADRFDDAFGDINGYSFESEIDRDESKSFYSDDNYLFYVIKDESRNVGMYSFSTDNGNAVLYRDQYAESTARGISILIEETDDVAPVVYATMLALNPELSSEEEEELYNGIFDNVGNRDGVSKNSINYVLYKENGYPGYHYFIVSALKEPN